VPSYTSTIKYFSTDFPRQLFPLETNRLLIENAGEELGKYFYQKITHRNDSGESFLPQVRSHAAKPGYHLRRTLKLDPIAEFYLYDMTYRHRTTFRKSRSKSRQNFGYQFSSGTMISPARSYKQFRREVHEALEKYDYCVKTDISQYFNSLYHHDLITWFGDYAKSEDDIALFGKYFREINAGRSVDFLPQGIYPSKIIGSQFLRFIDDSNRIRAKKMLRFMDDIYLFDNSEDVLKHDFLQLQRLIGEKCLGVNEAKTQIGKINEMNVEAEVDVLKTQLLERRSDVVFGSGAEEEDEIDDEESEVLGEEELEYLMEMLRDDHLEEEDAELILAIMRDHAEDVMEYIPILLRRFPALSKNVFYFSAHVEDHAELLGFIRSFVSSSDFVTEYQLFWMAKI